MRKEFYGSNTYDEVLSREPVAVTVDSWFGSLGLRIPTASEDRSQLARVGGTNRLEFIRCEAFGDVHS